MSHYYLNNETNRLSNHNLPIQDNKPTQSPKRIKFHVKNKNLNSNKITDLPTNSNKKDRGFRAILCNAKKRIISVDIINNIASHKNAGIILITEPNAFKSKRDNYFESTDNKVAIKTNQNLVGATDGWKSETNFVHFNWNNYLIICCYLNPNDTHHELEISLLKLEMIIQKSKKKVIITGDFNSRSTLWGDKTTNFRGKMVEEWFLSNDLYCHNDGDKFIPTFSNYNGESVIDLIFTTQDIKDEVVIDILPNETLSDHKAIKITLNKGLAEVNFTNNVLNLE